jgi:hypothetical protein
MLKLNVVSVYLKTYALAYVDGDVTSTSLSKTSASGYATNITTYVNPLGSVPEVD